jgi:hypothetical protein
MQKCQGGKGGFLKKGTCEGVQIQSGEEKASSPDFLAYIFFEPGMERTMGLAMKMDE